MVWTHPILFQPSTQPFLDHSPMRGDLSSNATARSTTSSGSTDRSSQNLMVPSTEISSPSGSIQKGHGRSLIQRISCKEHLCTYRTMHLTCSSTPLVVQRAELQVRCRTHRSHGRRVVRTAQDTSAHLWFWRSEYRSIMSTKMEGYKLPIS